MKYKITTLVFAIILLHPMIGHSQNCNCTSNFEWMKKIFEENDAGFQYIIDKKGQQAYNIHNTMMLEKIKLVKNSTECSNLLSEWLKFFRSGHLGIEWLQNDTTNLKIIQAEKKETLYETLKIDIPKFEKYLATKTEKDFEGIWGTGQYKVGIKKDGGNYVGFIISSTVEEWKPGQVKLKILKTNDTWKLIYYMRDHSAEECRNPKWIGNNYFHTNGFNFKRISPDFPDDPDIENYLKSLNTNVPYLDVLNATTLYLRIPSFEMREKEKIDSILVANKDKILKTENLIIDLRNNGGGGDASFRELLPFLYTSPIRTVSVEFLSTKQNNQRFLEFSTTTEYDFDDETRQWMKKSYEELEQHLGEFVRLSNKNVNIDTLSEIYVYPKSVGIIINHGNASTTEQFLLAAKQSQKVKLFGTTTGGALDISNMYSIESPCKEFILGYCLSKSLRIPDMTIDDIGIQPDYYLDKEISPYKWVEFVNEVLNQK